MKKIYLLLAILISVEAVRACTSFCFQQDGRVIFGRNYDWVTGTGIVYSNQRGLFKTSLKEKDELSISWVSRYGSISFNQYGKEFPTGGMNENGLVVELMWLEGTRYPEEDSRPAVGVLQWIQYQLDNAANTAEVIASDKILRINQGATPLHYLVADARGQVASIEFIEGKMKVHQGKQLPFPVLTNSSYQQSAATAEKLVKKNLPLSHPDNSLDRFVKACDMIERLKSLRGKDLEGYAFKILNSVAQGDYTKWSIVYDITGKKIHFKTAGFKHIKTINAAGFDFSCTNSSLMFNMNQVTEGNITALFILPDKKLQQDLVEQAVRESSSHVNISREEMQRLVEYGGSLRCR